MDEHESTFAQPTAEQLAAFVAGDPVAEDEVLRLVLPQLHRWACKHHPNLASEDLERLIYQVAAETCRPAVRYDPTKSRLTTYMIGLLNLRVRDLYAAQQDIQQHEETDPVARENLLQAAYNDSDAPEWQLLELTREEFFARAETRLDPVELEFLRLMRAGEKSESVFVQVLAQHGGPQYAAARHDVKNAKVRLQRKLKTLATELGYQAEDLL